MPAPPFVLVTGTTRSIRRRSRVMVDEPYVTALAAAGLVPLVLPPVDPALAVEALADADGLVFTSGEDIDPRHFDEEPHPATGKAHQARDACEIALAKAAFEHRVPTLALCRGAQIVSVAFGGTLVQDIPAAHPHGEGRVHAVTIDAGSRLASIVGATAITVNSTHHQAVDRPGIGLTVVGRSPDGIIEAAESRDRSWWMVAVQWHPEVLLETGEDWDRRLFGAFAEEVRRVARRD